MWESAPVSEVEKLPLGIDGLVRYTIVKAKTSKQISAALLTDGRRWNKSNVTQWKQYGEIHNGNNTERWDTQTVGAPSSVSMDSVLFVFNLV